MDERYVSPLVNRINYLAILLSILAISSTQLSDLVVLKPSLIFSFELFDQGTMQVPYLWTLVTSIFVESSFAFLALHLFIINYIVIQNRESLEKQWTRRNFFTMLCVSGFLSSLTHFLGRMVLYKVFKSSYEDFAYCSLNFIVMALILGLR